MKWRHGGTTEALALNALADDLGLHTVRIARNCANATSILKGLVSMVLSCSILLLARVDFVREGEGRQSNFDTHRLAKGLLA